MFAAVFASGLVVLLVVGVLEQRSEAFTLGVTPASPITLPRGAELCQRSIESSAAFSRVRLQVDSKPGPAPGFDVRVVSRGRELAHASAVGILSGRRPAVITVGSVPEGGQISVCVRNTGRPRLQVYGNSGLAHPASSAYLDGEPIEEDLSLVFLRPREATLLSLTGDMVSRASVFRGEWIGAWSVWLVVILLTTAFPLLLYRALRDVER